MYVNISHFIEKKVLREKESKPAGAPKWNHSSVSTGRLAPNCTPPPQTPVSYYMELIVGSGQGLWWSEVSVFSEYVGIIESRLKFIPQLCHCRLSHWDRCLKQVCWSSSENTSQLCPKSWGKQLSTYHLHLKSCSKPGVSVSRVYRGHRKLRFALPFCLFWFVSLD